MSPRIRLLAALAGLAVLAAAGAVAALLLRPPASAPAGPPLVVGAVEDAATFGDPDAKVALAREAGLGALVFSARWSPPLTSPEPGRLEALRAAVAACVAAGIRPIVAVYQLSGVTPVTPEARAAFAAFAASIPTAIPAVRDVIVGNEPNVNLFWQPQFAPDGSSAAAPAFFQLLAETYDAIKAADPAVNVIGAGLGPRGSDRPGGRRPTHSPTAFLLRLGEAFRASGRTRPVMDMLSLHPYGESSSVPPDVAHPRSSAIGLADYEKLTSVLGEAFDGTAQPGSSLPIVYGEYGIESTVADRAASYTGAELPTVAPVDPTVQGERYAQAIAMAACQPTVRMLLLFHVTDEADLDRLQSGLLYADDSPKPSRDLVHAAIARVAAGGSCD